MVEERSWGPTERPGPRRRGPRACAVPCAGNRETRAPVQARSSRPRARGSRHPAGASLQQLHRRSSGRPTSSLSQVPRPRLVGGCADEGPAIRCFYRVSAARPVGRDRRPGTPMFRTPSGWEDRAAPVWRRAEADRLRPDRGHCPPDFGQRGGDPCRPVCFVHQAQPDAGTSPPAEVPAHCRFGRPAALRLRRPALGDERAVYGSGRAFRGPRRTPRVGAPASYTA